MVDLMQLIPNLMKAYTNIIPNAIFFGVIFGVVALGFWRRNRSVRLVSIVFIMLGPFLFFSDAGLMLGIPGSEKGIGLVLLAMGLAGTLLTFVKRS